MWMVGHSISGTVETLLLVLFLSCACHAAWSNDAIDRLSVPGPIDFNGTNYHLSWTSHPSVYYYKQEYLPAGESSERFRRMVLLEAIVQGTNVNGAVAAQINMLNGRRPTDRTVNFATFRNPKTGEVILDFIVSKEGEKEETVEWNAYRYTPLKATDGKRGVLLFGLSRRAYGADTTEFLRGLKSSRITEVSELAHYPLPVVQPKN